MHCLLHRKGHLNSIEGGGKERGVCVCSWGKEDELKFTMIWSRACLNSYGIWPVYLRMPLPSATIMYNIIIIIELCVCGGGGGGGGGGRRHREWESWK